MSFGVQIPSIPAERSVGCRPPVMHTFIHSPHRTHRARKSASDREPGGRTSSGAGLAWAGEGFITQGTGARGGKRKQKKKKSEKRTRPPAPGEEKKKRKGPRGRVAPPPNGPAAGRH